MKIVINKCFGGFSTSQAADDALRATPCEHVTHSHSDNALRTCPYLVEVVEQLGPAAAGRYARLEVIEIPDGVEFEIDEYDGIEHVAETHRTWG